MRRVGTAVFGLGLVLASTGCGSRVDTETRTADRAPVGAPTVAPATSSTIAPTTSTTTTPATTTTLTGVTFTTPPPTKAPASTAAPTTTPVDGTAAYCAAAKVYSVDDLLGLGKRIVDDPAAFLAAYDAMVEHAPAGQADEVKALGPLTRTAVGLVQKGEITTSEKLQSWLANTAPRADLEEWVKSQQTLAPKIKTTCP